MEVMGAILGSAGAAAVLTKVNPSRAACLASSVFARASACLRGTNIQDKPRVSAGSKDLAVGDLLPTVCPAASVPSNGSDAIQSKKSDPFSALGEGCVAGLGSARSALAPRNVNAGPACRSLCDGRTRLAR